MKALLEDPAWRDSETSTHQAALEENLLEVTEKLHATQMQLQEATKDCILGTPIHLAILILLIKATALHPLFSL